MAIPSEIVYILQSIKFEAQVYELVMFNCGSMEICVAEVSESLVYTDEYTMNKNINHWKCEPLMKLTQCNNLEQKWTQ